jgi:hypothetical protein
LCNKAFASNFLEAIIEQFYEHLKQHSREELEVLRRLAKMELGNPEAYEELKEIVMLDANALLLVERENGEVLSSLEL